MFSLVTFLPRAIVQSIPLLLGCVGETLNEKSGSLNLAGSGFAVGEEGTGNAKVNGKFHGNAPFGPPEIHAVLSMGSIAETGKKDNCPPELLQKRWGIAFQKYCARHKKFAVS